MDLNYDDEFFDMERNNGVKPLVVVAIVGAVIIGVIIIILMMILFFNKVNNKVYDFDTDMAGSLSIVVGEDIKEGYYDISATEDDTYIDVYVEYDSPGVTAPYISYLDTAYGGNADSYTSSIDSDKDTHSYITSIDNLYFSNGDSVEVSTYNKRGSLNSTIQFDRKSKSENIDLLDEDAVGIYRTDKKNLTVEGYGEEQSVCNENFCNIYTYSDDVREEWGIYGKVYAHQEVSLTGDEIDLEEYDTNYGLTSELLNEGGDLSVDLLDNTIVYVGVSTW